MYGEISSVKRFFLEDDEMRKMNKKLFGIAGGILFAASIFQTIQVQAAAETVAEATVTAGRSADINDSTGFVVLSDVVPDIIQEVRYFSTYNFVGDRINGYHEPCVLMSREAAQALKAVSDELKENGYRLKVYDAYRPQEAVDNFVAWAENLKDARMKTYFYPQVDKTRLFADGYIDAKSGHSRGSAIDLTLFDMKTGKEVDMGGTFDHFGLESHPDWCGDPETGKYTGKFKGNAVPKEGKITEKQFANRMMLRDVMLRHGFNPIDTEWWHFFLKNEPYPDMYFNFPVEKLNK